MCLLTFFPAGIAPDLAALTIGATTNNDGHGFAIVTANREIIVRKSMDAAALIAEFGRLRSQHCEGPALFHSRYATHGVIGEDNCHPFSVGNDGRTVFAHNGVMPSIVQPAKGDVRSDTRITADDFIPAFFRNLGSKRRRATFEAWMGVYNKAVILSVDGSQYPETSFILNERAGDWDNGIWYSNDGYKRRTYKWTAGGSYYRGSAGDWEWDAETRRFKRAAPARQWWNETQCEGCERDALDCVCIGYVRGGTGDLPRSGASEACWDCGGDIPYSASECPTCGWCADCLSVASECECYMPGYLKDAAARADAEADAEGASEPPAWAVDQTGWPELPNVRHTPSDVEARVREIIAERDRDALTATELAASRAEVRAALAGYVAKLEMPGQRALTTGDVI